MNPFEEPALILIFKTEDRAPGYDDSMFDRLPGVRQKLEQERAAGTPFPFRELPDAHPAKLFARAETVEADPAR